MNTNVNIIGRQPYPASKVTSVVTNVWLAEEGGGPGEHMNDIFIM